MELPEIAEFDSLLPDIISNKKYLRCDKKPLTAPGENYASVALAINIVVQNEDGEEETVHTVAKFLPSSQFMVTFMNVPFTVRNELGFYQTIVPTLRQFQKEQGSSRSLDFFPKFYTGRLSLDPSASNLDENSIIFMENLKVAGYTLWDNLTGFDLNITKIILENMAELHGAVLALKQHHPDVFNAKLEPFFDEYPIFIMDNNEKFMTSDLIVNTILAVVQEDELCVLYIEKIREMIQTCVKNLGLPKNTAKFREDTFASLIHDDLWVNNIMVKSHLNKVVDVKFLDWQLYEYASVTKDLIFFLCTSVEDKVFKDNFDELFKFYHKQLLGNLVELKCDTEKFNFGAFEEELQRVAREVAYFYVMIAIPSILPSQNNVWEVHEINKERLLQQTANISEICKNRIWLITRKFIQKGWI